VNADRLSLSVANRLSEVAPLAKRVAAFCAERGLPESVAYRINLALEEILTNTIKYGYAEGGTHEIVVKLQQIQDGMTVEIDDDARPFAVTDATAPDLSAPVEQRPIGGLGLHLVRALMDEVHYRRDDGHNHVTLIKRITPDDEAPRR
jgi:serine/threonine-protein kinase RsbW/sigma-B regulation protein RsbU (phosphoserine phosphatase)